MTELTSVREDAHYPEPYLILGPTTVAPELLPVVVTRLEQEFGALLTKTDPFLMPRRPAKPGKKSRPERMKQWLAIAEPTRTGRLTAIKRHCLQLEDLFKEQHPEAYVKIDVLFVYPHRIIRAHAKDGLHRLYLGDGIFASLLFYGSRNLEYEAYPATPKKYLIPGTPRFFNHVAKLWGMRD